MDEHMRFVKNTLEGIELADLKKTVGQLELIYKAKFPSYVPGTSRRQYVESVIATLVVVANEAVEEGRTLDVYLNTINMADKMVPGIKKKIPWYMKLFLTHKN